MLSERAWSRTAQNTEYQVRETGILSTRLVHEARFSYRRDYNHTTPLVDAVSINVLDAFNAGGAQNESVNDNRALEWVDIWMYSRGKWSFKSGVQLLRRVNHNVNYNNFAGTYTFSTLDDYIAGHPVTFSKYQGNPFLDDSQIEFGTFFQSEWKVSKTSTCRSERVTRLRPIFAIAIMWIPARPLHINSRRTQCCEEASAFFIKGCRRSMWTSSCALMASIRNRLSSSFRRIRTPSKVARPRHRYLFV